MRLSEPAGTERRQDRFTLLTKTHKEIFALDKGKFKALPPMTTRSESETTLNFPKVAKKGEASGKDKALSMVQPWERVARQRITQSFSPNPEILFPSLGYEGTEGLILIEAKIGGHCIHRMCVDGGSASEIGDEEHTTSAWMNFVVVRSPSSHNGIIRRPGVRKLQVVSPIAHGMLKLPMEGGVTTLKSSKMVPLECTMVFGPEGNLSVTKQKIKERVKVRQNKRGQAADKNQAIQEEIGKLVEAGIMKEMPFGLKNARATYQRLVDKAFHKQIGRNLEVYVDDLVIKSRTRDEIVRDIEETFKTLREINMKLNPKKCTFGVEEWMFLGYKVSTRGLKVCPDKKSDFHWTVEAKEAFKKIKQLIAELPRLAVVMEKEELIVYLAAAKET
nr:reverse transcriptase domain-containing protein [Tanacetum cinerariifolium]